MAQKFDLLGHPIPDNHGQSGRDGHVPTPENASNIRQLLANGLDKKTIAKEMGLSTYILNTHYLNRCPTGRLQAEALMKAKAENLLRLNAAASKGNVSAMKELQKIYERREIEMIEVEMAKDPKPQEKIGKKVQSHMDALQAEEEFDQLFQDEMRH